MALLLEMLGMSEPPVCTASVVIRKEAGSLNRERKESGQFKVWR